MAPPDPRDYLLNLKQARDNVQRQLRAHERGEGPELERLNSELLLLSREIAAADLTLVLGRSGAEELKAEIQATLSELEGAHRLWTERSKNLLHELGEVDQQLRLHRGVSDVEARRGHRFSQTA